MRLLGSVEIYITLGKRNVRTFDNNYTVFVLLINRTSCIEHLLERMEAYDIILKRAGNNKLEEEETLVIQRRDN
jgi:hypothetical protein